MTLYPFNVASVPLYGECLASPDEYPATPKLVHRLNYQPLRADRTQSQTEDGHRASDTFVRQQPDDGSHLNRLLQMLVLDVARSRVPLVSDCRILTI